LIDHNISFRRFLRKRIMLGRDLGATRKTLHWLARLSREDSAAGADCPGFLSHRQPSPGLTRAKAVEVRANPEVKLLFADSPISWPESAFEEGSPD
jgi:hypothetical protein